jgi:hypothetical protein
MPERPKFQQQQYAFAAHIRDPQNTPAPEGVEERRMAIYRELFFNNLKSLLSSMFPVLKKLHSDEHWNHLVRSFMQRHQAKTPYFLELPAEFLEFLQNEYEPGPDDFPFLVELAHYEYIEIALSISEDVNDPEGVDAHGDLLSGVPVKSVLAWVYAYRYPVHQISAEFLPDSPAEQPVYLAVYRSSDDKVRFLELNAVTAGLLNAIQDNESGLTGEALLYKLAADINYPDVDGFVAHGLAAMQEMLSLDILTGTRGAG